MSFATNRDPSTNAVRQQMLYDASRKSVGVAYLLWLFTGMVGGHRFYLGQTGTAVAQLLLFLLGITTVVAGVGIVLLGIDGVWVLIDAFLIPGLARESNIRLADSLTRDS